MCSSLADAGLVRASETCARDMPPFACLACLVGNMLGDMMVKARDGVS